MIELAIILGKQIGVAWAMGIKGEFHSAAKNGGRVPKEIEHSLFLLTADLRPGKATREELAAYKESFDVLKKVSDKNPDDVSLRSYLDKVGKALAKAGPGPAPTTSLGIGM